MIPHAAVFETISPAILPPLEPSFVPAALANRAFLKEAAQNPVPLVLGLEREDGTISRYETIVFAEVDPRAEANLPSP